MSDHGPEPVDPDQPPDPRVDALNWALREIEREVGPVVGSSDEVAGTAPGWRIRTQIADQGPVFLKIADHTGWSHQAVGGEAALLTTVKHRHMPHVIGCDPTGPVPWMVLADLSTSTWPPPWPDDLSPIWTTLGRLSRALPPPWLPEPDDVDPWADTDDPRGEVLGAAARRVSLAGRQLVHGDLGSGNLCVGRGGVTVIDWTDAYVGNPAMDVVTLAVDIAHTSGRRVDVPVEDPGGWLAKVAGLLVSAAARPAWPGPGGALVREQQSALASTAVAWALDLAS